MPDRPELVASFEHFARLPFYRDLNQKFVDSVNLQPGAVVVDLACGPGNITQLIAERVKPSGIVFAVDMLPVALEAARRNLEDSPIDVNFVQGQAENLSRLIGAGMGNFDAVVCGNAIHNFVDKEAALDAVWDLLKEGGTFSMNSTFFDGGVPEDQRAFYGAWMSKAMRGAIKAVRSLGEASPLANTGDIREGRVEARKQLTPQEYKDLLEAAGFQILSLRTMGVDMPLEGFQAISEDDEFAEAIPRVPLDIAKKALAEAATEVFAEKGITASRRNWLEIIAVKPYSEAA